MGSNYKDPHPEPNTRIRFKYGKNMQIQTIGKTTIFSRDPVLKQCNHSEGARLQQAVLYSVCFVQNDRSLMVFASSLNVAEVEQVFTQEEGKIVKQTFCLIGE
jgi:hypothetical protein